MSHEEYNIIKSSRPIAVVHVILPLPSMRSPALEMK